MRPHQRLGIFQWKLILDFFVVLKRKRIGTVILSGINFTVAQGDDVRGAREHQRMHVRHREFVLHALCIGEIGLASRPARELARVAGPAAQDDSVGQGRCGKEQTAEKLSRESPLS